MLCNDLHTALSEFLRPYAADQIVVVQDTNISFDTPYPTLRLATDEAHKSIETVTQIWDFLFDRGLTRRGLVIAVGGGVLTDLAGFAAATYKRGIDYINIPTTLLAMIDASTGGKTGFNYRGLKNSIGAFAPPVVTLIYPQWIQMLPPHQFLSGYAEMLKTGLLNTKLWPQLLHYDLDTMPIEPLTPLIEQSIAVKERIVAADPQEKSARKALNLGHTFGHALEEIQLVNGTSSKGRMLHGYAVLYGMIAELYISVTKLGCPKELLQHLTQLMLHYYGRPDCRCSDREQLIKLMYQDKKNERADEINCTLLRTVGAAAWNTPISHSEALEALEYLFSL